jgi:hypothetical protein
LQQFLFPVPFAKLKDTEEALASTKISRLAVTMDLQNVSIQFARSEIAREAIRQKLMPELWSEARKSRANRQCRRSEHRPHSRHR